MVAAHPPNAGLLGPVDRSGTWWRIAFGVADDEPELDSQELVTGALGAHLDIEIVSTDPWTARMELVDFARAGCSCSVTPPISTRRSAVTA